jgi:glycosyltransferase involved in cell wall biosynthesis
VGEGNQEAVLKQQAERLGITNRVVFFGKKTPLEIIHLFKRHWASVLPCQWFEIFGLTVAESMAIGCPVIASNLGAMPELLGLEMHHPANGETSFLWASRGMLIEPPYTASLVTAIEALWQAPQQYEAIRMAGWQWARQALKANQHITQLQSIYAACIAEKSD